MTPNTGDRIKHKQSHAEYSVISVNPYSDTFIARRDFDGSEVDFSLKHFDIMFDILEVKLPAGCYDPHDFWSGTSQTVTKCECGVDTIGSGLHSSYCPKYYTNNV